MLLLAVTIAGCGSPVRLLTGRGDLEGSGMVGCYPSFARGQLVTDPTYGTAIIEHAGTMPVMWPPGYVGRQIGSDIEILDTFGQVVARTGNLVQLPGGYSGSEPRVFLTCGYVR
jgi:hypothetical protein